MDNLFNTEVDEQMEVAVDEVETLVCSKCSKTFIRKDALARHIQTVHDNNEFPCLNCSSKFTRKYNLVQHTKRVHDISVQKEKF